MTTAFQDRYGPWALVAGGGAGIGAAHARLAAANGLNVAVIDKDTTTLDAFVATLRERHPEREFLALALDLNDREVVAKAIDALGQREIGLLIYNSAVSDVGPFYKANSDIEFERSKIQVNMASPFEFVYQLARPMLKRGRGGIVLMSSGTGYQGRHIMRITVPPRPTASCSPKVCGMNSNRTTSTCWRVWRA